VPAASLIILDWLIEVGADLIMTTVLTTYYLTGDPR